MRASDVLVIGGGVFGLWAARACLARGLSVTLAEAGRLGEGIAGAASGGPLGALAPHAPERWNAKKGFQLAALLDLPHRLAALEAETGLSAGYARIGRIQPLRDADARALAERRAAAAAERWRGAAGLRILDAPRWPGWAPQAPAGLLHDDLSARLAPRRYLRALAAALGGRARILEGWRLRDWRAGRARFDRGEIAAGATILAAGSESFALLAPLLGRAPGGGVKGQALLLDHAAPEGAPLIYEDGLFIVPQAGGGVAIGATAEKSWADPGSTDAALDALHARAARRLPALAGAPVRLRWAGLRPRARGRDPMIGPVPGHPGLIVASGGFRIGLGIAHAVGGIAAALAAGEAPDYPESFRVEAHLAA